MINHLEELRKQRGIRQEDLAQALGASRQTVISLEKGKYNPSLALAFKLARYFNLSIEAVPGADGKVPDILPQLPVRTVGEYKVHVPDYAGHAPGPEDTLEFTFIPRPAKSPELRITWKILGADLVK